MSFDAFERYRRGEIGLSEAADELRAQRGRFPTWALGDPAYVLGWLIHRVVLCILGKHVLVHDWKLHVPYYGYGHETCVVCGVVKVKP